MNLKITTVYIRKDQAHNLKKLKKVSKKSVAKLIRMGIDMALKKHGMQ